MNDTRLSVDIDQDSLPPITVGLYRAFLAKGKRGIEALTVYQHLLFTYRLQHTNIVQANNPYIMNGLKMGENRVKAAKALLRSMGLILTIRRHSETGKIVSTFTQLNLLPNPGATIGPDSAPMVKSPEKTIGPDLVGVVLRDKCLKKESKCLKKESAAPIAKPQAPPSEPSPRKQKDGRSEKSPKVSRPPAPDVRPDFETKQWIGVTAELFEHWEWCYPAVDIELEMRSALDFAYSHPEKQYTKWLAYLTGWFRRTQQRKGAA